MSVDLTTARIAVTGGKGFLGSYVCRELRTAGASSDRVLALGSDDFDLRDRSRVSDLYSDLEPDVVIHLAAVVGGIGANCDSPGRFLYENLVMGLELIEAGRRFGRLQKLVVIGTVCSYPKHTPVPFRESELWRGYPDETNAPYGLAKKMLLAQLEAYRRQYAFPGVFLMPTNLYGPGDDFDRHSSHVIPAVIRKLDEAIERERSEVKLWGDGTPTREFLHARDAARGIVLATERYEGHEPVNLGTGVETSIADLAIRLGDLLGFEGRIVWDRTKPNGQPRRLLDVSRARERFGFRARIDLDQGLRETVAWWREHRARLVRT